MRYYTGIWLEEPTKTNINLRKSNWCPSHKSMSVIATWSLNDFLIRLQCAANYLFVHSRNKKVRYLTDNTSPLDPVLSNIPPVNNPPRISLIQLYYQLHLQTISQQAFSLPACRPKFLMHFSLLHKCYISHQHCSPSLKRLNNTSKRVQIINFLIM